MERQEEDPLALVICDWRENKRDEMEGAHPVTVCSSNCVSFVVAQKTHIHNQVGDSSSSSSSHNIMLLFLILLVLTELLSLRFQKKVKTGWYHHHTFLCKKSTEKLIHTEVTTSAVPSGSCGPRRAAISACKIKKGDIRPWETSSARLTY